MPSTDTVVIGAGHAGLSVSRLLTEANRDHVVLDRGRIAERWRSERWDSLHLLTPSWMTRLPHWRYAGPDPDGFLAAGEFIELLEGYAESFAAPVETGTTVMEVDAAGSGYRVVTDRGIWTTRHVVIAAGPWGKPRIPQFIGRTHSDVHVAAASGYRNPATLPGGGVLVVGASSSGMQIADELARAGRRVVLAVGRHTRMPRRYRGMDIFWWLERTGRLSRTIDEVADPVAARNEPSLQLIGRPSEASLQLIGRHDEPHHASGDLDLPSLRSRGVQLTGRLRRLDGGRASFDDTLADSVAAAEDRMHRFLDAVDRHIDETGLGSEVWQPDRPRPLRLTPTPATLDLQAGGIGTVLLATGYRPHHPWLRLPIVTADGAIRQHRGITPAPGVYVVGQRFQHRRDSAFIDGARHDAAAVVSHICSGQHPSRHPAESTNR